MIDKSHCKLLGILAKAHGIDGSILLRLKELETNDIKEPESVFIEIDGLLVPFFIERVSEKSNKEMIIRFEDVDTVEKAGELTGFSVFIDSSLTTQKQKPSFHGTDIAGYQVIDNKLGYVGIALEIVESTNNPLIRLTKETREYYIPFHQDIVLNIDHTGKKIIVDSPDGLFEI